ncbi:MAG: cyclic nucleotide-binding domain-containing protein [Candidatus Marinimicrobia bacterium]|nr:cyclic nucleotide-binding domain-containing protein [Candidatus Neomarinimicrobiota bacterium]
MDNPFWKYLSSNKNSDEKELITIIKQVPIFENLPNKTLKDVAKIVYRRQYEEGEIIFHKGDPGLGMYIIISGKVDIVEDKEGEIIRKYATLEANDFLGEMALLDEKERSATAIVKEECDALGFFRPDLMELLRKKPKTGNIILYNLARVIGERLRQTNAELIQLEKKIENG